MREAILDAMRTLESQTYRATQLVVSPRTAHAAVRWYRWIHLTRNIVWADPRWPRFIRYRIARRRRRAAEARFSAWLKRHPYVPSAAPMRSAIPGAIVSDWLPPGVDALKFNPDALNHSFLGLRTMLSAADEQAKGPAIGEVLDL
jgi:hypothetical protein